MRIGSLFSGIGGLEMGLEWAGVGQAVWQVEQDAYCQQVLARHWPDAKRYNDVHEVGSHTLEPVDVICGGYPCQPFSVAGARRGAADARHLWPEFARILRELRPSYVVLENVPAHLSLGFGGVLGDLSNLGYDAEWSVISACAFGAPQTRSRLFVLAYRPREWLGVRGITGDHPTAGSGRNDNGNRGPINDLRQQWAQEPGVDRVVNGVPHRVQRNKALGNAVVPQVAQRVGERLLEIHHALRIPK